jgi:hypothetical protein
MDNLVGMVAIVAISQLFFPIAHHFKRRGTTWWWTGGEAFFAPPFFIVSNHSRKLGNHAYLQFTLFMVYCKILVLIMKLTIYRAHIE